MNVEPPLKSMKMNDTFDGGYIAIIAMVNALIHQLLPVPVVPEPTPWGPVPPSAESEMSRETT